MHVYIHYINKTITDTHIPSYLWLICRLLRYYIPTCPPLRIAARNWGWRESGLKSAINLSRSYHRLQVIFGGVCKCIRVYRRCEWIWIKLKLDILEKSEMNKCSLDKCMIPFHFLVLRLGPWGRVPQGIKRGSSTGNIIQSNSSPSSHRTLTRQDTSCL